MAEGGKPELELDGGVSVLDEEIVKAIKNDNLETVQKWFEGGTRNDPNFHINAVVDVRGGQERHLKAFVEHNKMTALNYAAFFARLKIIDFLLAKKADPRVVNVAGENALHCAVSGTGADDEIVKVVERLLEDRVDYIDVMNNNSQTCLSLAIAINLPRTVQLLLDKGAEAESVILFSTLFRGSDRDFKNMIATFEANLEPRAFRIFLSGVDEDGKTALQLLLKRGYYSRMKILIDFGADPLFTPVTSNLLAPEAGRITAITRRSNLLHYAAVKDGTYIDFKNTVELVMKSLDDSDAFREALNARNEEGQTSLHLVINERRYPRMFLLLNHGADPAVTNDLKRNCLHHAFVEEATGEVVEALLSAMMSLNEERFRKDPSSKKVSLETEKDKVDESEKDKDPDESEKGKLLEREMGKVPVEKKYSRRYPVQYLTEQTPLSAIKALEYPAAAFKLQIKNAPGLRTAFKARRNDILAVLLVKGAWVDLEIMSDAINRGREKVALILVRYAEEKELKKILKCPSRIASSRRILTEEFSEGTFYLTWFGQIIKKMPAVAKEALERCVEVQSGRYPEVTFEYDYLKFDNDDITNDELPLTISGGEKSSDDIDVTDPKEKQPLLHNGGVEEGTVPLKDGAHSLRLVFADPLRLMIKYHQADLELHPVVQSYVYRKWKTFGFIFYAIRLVLFFLLIGFLSLFAVTVNHPLGVICTEVSNSASIDSCGASARSITAYVCSACVIPLAIYHIIAELVWFWLTCRTYILVPRNYFQWVFYITAIIFVISVFVNECGCPPRWQWEVGIASIFFGWLVFILIASQIPLLSIYVIMFSDILITFSTLVLFALLLICTFSLVLFMMFHNPNSNLPTSSFSNTTVSFLSTINMITGGVGFDSLFGINVQPTDYVPIPYHIFNFIMWVLFLILFPIIFKNMLISLAVDDVKNVRERAEHKKDEIKVGIFTSIRLVRSSGILFRILLLWNTVFERDFDGLFPLSVEGRGTVNEWFTAQVWGRKDFLIGIENNTYALNLEKDRAELAEKSTAKEDRRLDAIQDLVESLREALDNSINRL